MVFCVDLINKNIILEEELISHMGSGQDFRGFNSNCVISHLPIKVVFSNKTF